MTIPVQPKRFAKKEKQGFRLASFAPVLLPIAPLPKPGFGNLVKNGSQFRQGCRYKKHIILRFFAHFYPIVQNNKQKHLMPSEVVP